ncbi:MAG: type I-C CRISPR-associated protein Cas8c/Csd1 [Deltaproteobacteria bacterium]|nr:type I-C CRISPR-associated protein Cas8c/Csd1 [Deltaproteobacteria bacterium]
MSWMRNLSITYDNCRHKIGDSQEVFPLLPIGHTTLPSTVEIILDSNGNFLRANSDNLTIVAPCTEESVGRAGSKIASHPIFDEFKYVAGDYLIFGGILSKSFEKNGEILHCNYVELLSDWCLKNPYYKAEIVLKYIQKKCMISDLVRHKIIVLDSKDIIEHNPTMEKLLKGSVRFSVEVYRELQTHLWTDKEMWKSWTDYYLNTRKTTGLCYATGQNLFLAQQHPKKILPYEANAKLISSNDTSGFTYRGRFLDDAQACSVGYEVSQKAHNALIWLVRRQGSSHGTQSIVAWATQHCDIPAPASDTLSLLLHEKKKEDSRDESFNAAQNLGIEFKKMINGYKGKLGNTEHVIVMSLDSMTSGRAAITYYRELTGSEYLERIERWHSHCSWLQNYGKGCLFYGAPSPADITEAAFGTNDEKKGKLVVPEKLYACTIERLLPCIIDSFPIPFELVNRCVENACRRHAFSKWQWEKMLGVTCAVYKYFNSERNCTMNLEEVRKTRDGLYGCLLALADHLEDKVLWMTEENKTEDGKKKGRLTCASRLMQRFSTRPYTTWTIIELALMPYRQKLKSLNAGLLTRIEKEIDTVMSSFGGTTDFSSDDKLSGEFLLGFHVQRAKLWEVSGTPDKIDDNNNQVQETNDDTEK